MSLQKYSSISLLITLRVILRHGTLNALMSLLVQSESQQQFKSQLLKIRLHMHGLYDGSNNSSLEGTYANADLKKKF